MTFPDVHMSPEVTQIHEPPYTPPNPVPVAVTIVDDVRIAHGSGLIHEEASDFGAAFTLTFTGTEQPLNLLPYDVNRARAYITCTSAAGAAVPAVADAAVSTIAAATAGNVSLPHATDALTGFSISLSTVGTAAMTVTLSNVSGGPYIYTILTGASGLTVTFPQPVPSTGSAPNIAWTATAAAVGNVALYGLTAAAAGAVAGPVYVAFRDPSGLVAVRANGLVSGQAPVYALTSGITLPVTHKQAVYICPDGTHAATVTVSVERWES